ncbi:hypothetical protein IHC92_20600 [Photobacterium damselae subsp. damselae]|uniref:hypothetical protein n=1 Tax=Photobacterium damselae TaxID=38293 RepID=UPI001F3CF861|nr:hypothetical protein [Photobacterium damselae]UKA23354.1 hypothetical protein IHC92_20600 [Photobacterium damselae subsp. damselae]
METLIITTGELKDKLGLTYNSLRTFFKNNPSFPEKVHKGQWCRKSVMDWFKANGYI